MPAWLTCISGAESLYHLIILFCFFKRGMIKISNETLHISVKNKKVESFQKLRPPINLDLTNHTYLPAVIKHIYHFTINTTKQIIYYNIYYMEMFLSLSIRILVV